MPRTAFAVFVAHFETAAYSVQKIEIKQRGLDTHSVTRFQVTGMNQGSHRSIVAGGIGDFQDKVRVVVGRDQEIGIVVIGNGRVAGCGVYSPLYSVVKEEFHPFAPIGQRHRLGIFCQGPGLRGTTADGEHSPSGIHGRVERRAAVEINHSQVQRQAVLDLAELGLVLLADSLDNVGGVHAGDENQEGAWGDQDGNVGPIVVVEHLATAQQVAPLPLAP